MPALEVSADSVQLVVGIQDRINDSAFDTVSRAYADATKRPKFWKAKRSEKVEQSCREFMRLQFLLGTSTSALMAEAVGMYNSDWCKEIFKSEHPPFNVVVGEKCRKRLIHAHKPKVAQTAQSILIQGKEIARNLVNLMGKDEALSIVQEGWPQDERLRAAVFLEIKEEHSG